MLLFVALFNSSHEKINESSVKERRQSIDISGVACHCGNIIDK